MIIHDDQNRWIIQKNVNDPYQLLEVVQALGDLDYQLNYSQLLNQLKNYSYTGRSKDGSESTIGVRISQLKFFMFGYESKMSKEFIPTPITLEMFKGRLPVNALGLGNLFMMQFPHPNSSASDLVELFPGRLIVSLLLEERLDYKLFIDECIFILPFVLEMTPNTYEQLINYILEFRKKSYSEKKEWIKETPGYEKLFAKVTHEMNYYFIRVFKQLGVFDVQEDKSHNQGNKFGFKQGKNSIRYDSYAPRSKYSGFIKLRPDIIGLSEDLLNKFSIYEKPYKLGSENIWTENDLYSDMYIKQAMSILSVIDPQQYMDSDISIKLDNMRDTSINSPDGKAFEESLMELFKEFDETLSVDWLSGSGKTDLFCMLDLEEVRKINVEAKSGSSANNVNVIRIIRHMDGTSANYCLMVAPRISRGTKLDISGTNICAISADILYQYCVRMLIVHDNRRLPYAPLDQVIMENMGTSIDDEVERMLTSSYYL